MTEDQDKLNSIFSEALAQATPEERERYLARACGQDAELRAAVDSLIAAHESAGDFLRQPAVPQADPQPPTEGPGTVIGRYKLLQQIGEGGFGLVFMAEQREPVQRLVALKVLKAGMDTREVVARFEAERQALAVMDHPNIARVLDGGTTAGGRPYFVMDLVKGIPITEFCDQNQLSTEARLGLFIKVCAGVQHAHQKGIIHRDLKPSNVLVTVESGEPVPKVIDFGIAKALGRKLTERTLFTRFEQLIGTPAYMSPEQAEWGGTDIDTRSDIYSLGALLYELLTATTPFEKETLAKAALEEVRRMIRETDPPTPSLRLQGMGQRLEEVSRRRKTAPSLLPRKVRGELDWIVMKALEKDRTRRYETVIGLARDIQRHLEGEPVVACPPTAGYRLQKFVGKHQLIIGVAAGFVLVLAIATAVSTRLAIRARREKARATQAEKEARKQAEEAKAVLGFLTDKILTAARPEGQEGGLGREVTVRQAVEAAESQIAVMFTNQPLVEADIRDALGQTFQFLGDYAKAIQQQERVMALANANLGANDPVRLDYLNNLAVDYQAAGHLDAALPLLEETLQRRRARFGPDHLSTLEAMNNLGVCHWRAGRVQDALSLFKEVLQRFKASLGPDDPHTLKSMQNLAAAYNKAGHPEEAVPLFEEAVQKAKAKLGPNHADTLLYMGNLAEAYTAIGRHPEAIQLLEDALQKRKTVLGPDHPDTLETMSHLGLAYHGAGRLPEALPLVEEAMQRYKAKRGPDDPATLQAMENLAVAYRYAARFAESELLLRQVLSSRRKNGGTNTTELLALASTLQKLGKCLVLENKHAEAEPVLRDSVDIHEKTRVISPQSNSGGTNLTELLSLAAALDSLADCLLAQKKLAEAEPFLREALSIYEATAARKSQISLSRGRLGKSLLEQKKYAEAEPLLERSYQGIAEQGVRTPGESKALRLAGEQLVELYEAWGIPEAAARWRKKLPEADGPPSTSNPPVKIQATRTQ
jgi:tetratricopeptide (TPR) repeat protein